MISVTDTKVKHVISGGDDKMLKRILTTSLLFPIIMLIICKSSPALAARKSSAGKVKLFYTEISIFGSASKYSNSQDMKTFVTSWGGSLGFTFAGTETVELEYKNAYQKSNSSDLLVKTFYDTYGVNYLHALSRGRFQPFLKIGLGYVRSRYVITSETYPELERQEKRSPTISYTGGIGLKIYITRSISIKGSYTAQFIDADESPSGDSNTEFNYFLTGGLSFIF